MDEPLVLAVDARQVQAAGVSLDSLAQSGARAETATKSLTSATDILARVYRDVAASAALWKAYDYIRDAALLQARYETLGVAMTAVGRNVGYTAQQMEDAATQMQKTGISMNESRSAAMQLVQAHIDLADSSKLARVAQDAAVIGNINSSEAFGRLVHGIQAGQVEILRTIGINVTFEEGYKHMADTLGKNVNALTDNEKTQSRLNLVMDKGKDIAGTYEAAMNTAGKQILSMQRYSEDLKVKQGELFNEALTVAVMAYAGHLKDANGEMDHMAANGELTTRMHEIASAAAFAADAIMGMTVPFRLLGIEAGAAMAQVHLLFTDPKLYFSGGAEAIAAGAEKDRQAVYTSTHMFRDALDQRRVAVAEKSAAELADARAQGQAMVDTVDFYYAKLEAGAMTAAAYDKKMRELYQNNYGDNHKYGDTSGGGKEAAVALSKEEQAFNSLLDASKKYDAEMDAQLIKGIALTQAEKTLTEAKEKLTPLLYKEIEAWLKGRIAKEAILKLTTDQIKADEAAAQRYVASYDTTEKSTQSILDGTKAMRESSAEMMLSSDALLALKQSRIDDEIAEASRQLRIFSAGGFETEYTLKIRESIAALEDRKKAMGEATQASKALEAIKAQGEQWKSVEAVAHTTWGNIERDGIGSLKRLGDTLKSAIWDMLYQMTVKKWIVSIAASISGTGAATSAFGSSAVGSALGSSFGGSALGTYASSAWAATGGQFIAGYQGASLAAGVAGPTTAGAGGMMGAGQIVAEYIPYVAAAVAAYYVWNKITNSDSISSSNTGDVHKYWDAAGGYAGQGSANGSNATIEAAATSLQNSYMQAAMAMGITTAATHFGVNTNNGAQGQSPQTMIWGDAGNSKYYSGEVSSSDTAGLQLAASRAVFTALQGSQLPGYLSKLFDGLTAGTMTLDQINSVETFGAQLKSVRDALTETRTPLQILQDQVTAGTAALSTSADTFKNDFVKAIDAGMGPTQLAQWQALGTSLDSLATASAAAAATVATVSAAMQTMQNDSKSLALDLLRAQGDPMGAAGVNKNNPAEVAQYTANEAVRTEIKRLDDLTAAANSAAQASFDLTKSLTASGTSLQAQHVVLTGLKTQRDIDILGMTVEQAAIYDSNAAVQTLITTYNSQKAAADQLAATNKGWQDQLDVLTGAETARSIALRDAGDASTRAIMTQVYALQDTKTAADAAAAAAKAQQQAVSSFWNSVASSFDNQKKTLEATITRMDAFTASIQKFKDSLALGSNSALSNPEKYAVADAAFIGTSQRASTGNEQAISDLPGTITALLEISRAVSSDALAYGRDYARAQNALDVTAQYTQGMSTSAAGQIAGIPAQMAAYAAAVRTMMPGFASGTDSVPAMLTPGERVISVGDNRQLMARLRDPQQNSDAIVAELRAVRTELTATRAELAEIKKTNKSIADLTQKADAIGPLPARTP